MKMENSDIYKMIYKDDPFEITGVFNLTKDKHEIHNLNDQSLIDTFMAQLKPKKLALSTNTIKN